PNELDRAAERAQSADHLLGFADRHPRVIRSVYHQQRRRNAVDALDGRDVFEKRAVILEAAVLRLAQVPPPRPGVLQEGHAVRDADEITATRPQLRKRGE